MNRDLITARPLRRFRSLRGRYLALDASCGTWRPSGVVAGAGVVAVVWSTLSSDFWAPLRDFAPADHLRLFDAYRWGDRHAGYPGAWPDGRCE
jgi:hypothetical protein